MTGPSGPPIVLVDDDVDFVDALAAALPPCDLHVFYRTAPALRYVRRNDPALILLDYDLPGPSGLALLSRIRSYLHLRHRPVLLLTAHQNRELLYEGFVAGLDDFLFKPVDLREVRLRVDRLLARSPRLVEQLRGPDSRSEEGESMYVLCFDRRAIPMKEFDSFLRQALLLLGGRSLKSRARLVQDMLMIIASPVPVKQLPGRLQSLKRFYGEIKTDAFSKTEEHFVEASPLRPLRLLALRREEGLGQEFFQAVFSETDEEFIACL
ncbi:MAG: response regulator [Spirochaetales bacterium]|nr:response regulator [Spirochaetales bacterium]